MGTPLDLHTGDGSVISADRMDLLAYGFGAPTDGVLGYHPGAIYIDTSNGYAYSNQGSSSSTSWKRVTVSGDVDDAVAALPTTEKVTIDCGAGGTAQTAAVITLAAGSILHNIVAVVTEAFNGDATTTLEVGITGNADKYIDSADYDETDATTPAQASMVNGTNNDQKMAEYIAASTAIIATWTNTASATTGIVDVYVTYTAPIT